MKNWKFPVIRTIVTPFIEAFGVMAVGVSILAHQWKTCEINEPALITQIGLFSYLPIAYAVGLVALFALSALLVRTRSTVYYPAMLLGGIVSTWLFIIISFSDYNDYSALPSACPGGIPHWWPRYIPLLLY
ncbi:MAG: hypothetical protein QM662_13125 [Gordonia sp. (in: high G+C Gram-positive bacteria)]